MNKPVGWRGEPIKHGLASQGIKTTYAKGVENYDKLNIWNVEDNEYLSFHYEKNEHRGSFLSSKTKDKEVIMKSLNDINTVIGLAKDIFTKYDGIRNYYEDISDDILDKELFEKPYVSVILDSDFERFGWGVSSHFDSLKIYWFNPELSYEYVKDEYKIFDETMPAVTLIHELQHVWGSRMEFKQPLAEVTGILFYLKHPGYVPKDKVLNYASNLIRRSVFHNRYPKEVNKDILQALYDNAKNDIDVHLRANLHPDDYKTIRGMVEHDVEE